MRSCVAVYCEPDAKYPGLESMISSDAEYDEFLFPAETDDKENCIPGMLKGMFRLMGLDKEHEDTPFWNPLQDDLIRPGDTVLLKPNLVLHDNLSGGGNECLYTQPSLVAALIPYVWKAMEKRGKIFLADAPVQGCDFLRLTEESGYSRMVSFFRDKGVDIELKDLRGLISREYGGVLVSKLTDETGIVVDIGEHSAFYGMSDDKLSRVRVTDYDPSELVKHCNTEKHEYNIAKCALAADVIINLPKPKAQRFGGLTLGMKNLVGINVRKEYLPHHRKGSADHGGDEYKVNTFLMRANSSAMDLCNSWKAHGHYGTARLMKLFGRACLAMEKYIFSREFRRFGNWYGNDTIWRTITDINRILHYTDKDGNLHDTPQRKIMTIADMIWIGEGEGPLEPTPKFAGIVAGGLDIVSFDEMIAALMGCDAMKMPLYLHISMPHRYPLTSTENEPVIASNVEKWDGKSAGDFTQEMTLMVKPTLGWKGHLELVT